MKHRKGVSRLRPAWIEIKCDHLRENVHTLRKCISDQSEFIAVIKADAYGHGAVETAKILKDEGIRHFAVAILQEGIELRKKGLTEPILIMGYTPEEDFQIAVEYGITLTIYTLSQAERLDRIACAAGKRVKVHIKLDTGMHRLGFLPTASAVEDIKKIAILKNLFIEGIFSHLATADRADPTLSREQFDRFTAFIKRLEAEGMHIPIKHLSNSAAALKYPQMHFDAVRVGISLYGIFPSPLMFEESCVNLRPVMEVKARLVDIRTVPPKTGIGYGAAFVTEKESVIGTVPMGYADGISTTLSNKAHVLVKGKRCPVAGRICMDQFMVDLTGISGVKPDDEVVVMGSQGKETISVEEIAQKAGIISYEVVTRMGKRLPRIYMNDINRQVLRGKF